MISLVIFSSVITLLFPPSLLCPSLHPSSPLTPSPPSLPYPSSLPSLSPLPLPLPSPPPSYISTYVNRFSTLHPLACLCASVQQIVEFVDLQRRLEHSLWFTCILVSMNQLEMLTSVHR